MVFDGEEVISTSEQELRDRFSDLSARGCYPYLCDEAQHRLYLFSETVQAEVAERLMRERLMSWIALAEEKLAGSETKILMMAGNDDPAVIDQLLKDRCAASMVQYAEGKSVDIGMGYRVMSIGLSNETPFDTPREVSRRSVEGEKSQKLCSSTRNSIGTRESDIQLSQSS